MASRSLLRIKSRRDERARITSASPLTPDDAVTTEKGMELKAAVGMSNGLVHHLLLRQRHAGGRHYRGNFGSRAVTEAMQATPCFIAASRSAPEGLPRAGSAGASP